MDAFLYKYNAEVNGRTCECVKIYTKDVIYSGVMDGIWLVKRQKPVWKDSDSICRSRLSPIGMMLLI